VKRGLIDMDRMKGQIKKGHAGAVTGEMKTQEDKANGQRDGNG